MNIQSVLQQLQMLMAEPNPDDALMADIVSTKTEGLCFSAYALDKHLDIGLSALAAFRIHLSHTSSVN
jgi:hypothetical protein